MSFSAAKPHRRGHRRLHGRLCDEAGFGFRIGLRSAAGTVLCAIHLPGSRLSRRYERPSSCLAMPGPSARIRSRRRPENRAPAGLSLTARFRGAALMSTTQQYPVGDAVERPLREDSYS